MLTTISDKVACWLVKNRVIEEEDFKIFSFAAFYLLFNTIPLVIFTIVCSIFHCGLYAFALSCATLAMRRYTGGYHASNPITCIIMSISVLSIGVGFIQTRNNDSLVFLGALVASIIVWFFSPIDSKNYRLKEHKKKKYRNYARETLLLELVLYLVLSYMDYDKLALSLAMGIIIAALLLAVCIPGQMMKE